VAELIAQSPFGMALPVKVEGCTLAAFDPQAITSITVEAGQEKPVSVTLKKSCGVAFPSPNRATGSDDLRCVWVAHGQALLLGKPLKPLQGAALTDQSDGWAVMRLQGDLAEAALARLVPIDLRATVFRKGHAAKTQLFHMPLSITRTGAVSFDLMVFRSMANTAVHELKTAMESVAAQAEIS